MVLRLEMKRVKLWRKMINDGCSVQDIKRSPVGMYFSETTIRNYTKAERARQAEIKKLEEQRIDLYYAHLAIQEDEFRRKQEAWDRGNYTEFDCS